MDIVIIDYGAGNVKSVQFALERLGISAKLSNKARIINSADKVIFPGVGHANAAMKEIRNNGLVEVIQGLKQPLLGICLGMQLLCKNSAEGHTECLGIIDANVKAFDNPALKSPQMGWNKLLDIKSPLFKGLKEEFVYYVNSYFVPFSKDYTIGTTVYGEAFSGAIQKDNFYGCQFHPEKSGDYGSRILRNFIEL